MQPPEELTRELPKELLAKFGGEDPGGNFGSILCRISGGTPSRISVETPGGTSGILLGKLLEHLPKELSKKFWRYF